ncbi:MAG: response regulator, partial [Vicinamibacteria bacterium]
MSDKGTVLVVDDEEVMRDILGSLLTKEGYRVKLAATGEEGLEVGRAEPVDVAIVDVMLPGLGGLDLIDALRRRGRTLPVLILSARHT